MKTAIFGAQAIALGLCQALRELCPNLAPDCFLVSEKRANAEQMDGLPVYKLDEFAKRFDNDTKRNLKIMIAVQENLMPEIEKMLESYGFFNHMRYDSVCWAEYMERYYVRTGKFKPLSTWPVGFQKADVRLYMAKSSRDIPLETDFTVPDYIYPVQAGAALCEEKVADLLDNDGDNISRKNGNYSELTVLYWIWKNIVLKDTEIEKKYYGLTHYRRILSLTKRDLMRLEDGEIDAVLPYPMPYEPNMDQHHKKCLKQEDWNVMLAVLEELQPEYAKGFTGILQQQYMYHYNIILARGEVLADYCSWLFTILERIEQLSVPKGNERSDRYIGYLSESLETLYFMYNQSRLNIAYAGCRFLL